MGLLLSDGADLTLDAGGDIILDADGSNVTFKDAGTSRFDFLLDATPQIKATGGTFDIENMTQDAVIRINGNDNGSVITALRLDMSDAGTAIFNHDITLPDNGKAIFGAGSDLQLYHDGTNHYITGTGGILNLTNNDIRFKTSGGETMVRAVANGAVEAMYDNTTRLATTSTGATTTGLHTSTQSANITETALTDGTVAWDARAAANATFIVTRELNFISSK